jgi:isoleucyl-tRNA synthetase
MFFPVSLVSCSFFSPSPFELQLWVSSVDYTGDVLIGPGIIRQMSDTYRKFRGTLRYLLGNLSDFDVSFFS